ncbi:MAG: hypothetical protein PHU26_00585 [Methanofollis liminatans]|jgi:peptidoglycan/LPS O-acetylase OafA/YrhL|uniref:Uncharacterized protein n=1 Tax=Methanofollis liminatans DSM 4140 TaxID=28892 RepID=J0S8N0_9EURY|nr:hypothetical protein [Methanofollis liminatans]EJG06954.1 hypothetical protein Metli_0996 [Methanofollis liminatans DSM 4140]MDD3110774.1 hypothetical protein [Methanofollis liminatans]
MIRTAIAGGAAVYGAIMVVQALQRPSAAAGAIAAALLLAAAGILLWSGDEHRLKRVEMALLWCCAALFLVYGLLASGGVI